MISKTQQRKVRSANRQIAEAMVEMGLDPNSHQDRMEYSRRYWKEIMAKQPKRIAINQEGDL